MNQKETTKNVTKNVINVAYIFFTILVVLFTVVVLGFVFSPNKPNPADGFDFYWMFWPVLLGYALAFGIIPMGLVSIGAYHVNQIKERPNKRKSTLLLFLPTMICAIAVLVWIGLFVWSSYLC